MKKRILAALLAVMMLCCAFTGCAEDELSELLGVIYGTTTSSNNPEMTISLYCVCDYATDEAIEEVEAALNSISVKKFNTKIELYLYTEEEYVSVIFYKAQEAMNSYIAGLDDEAPTIDYEKSLNFANEGINLVDLSKHPELTTAGFDIFLIYTPEADSVLYDSESEYYNAYAANKMFDVMYEAQVLQNLTSYFTNDYAILKSKSYNEFFKAVTKDDFLTDSETPKQYAYAMPNNYVVGEYQFLVVNKSVVSEVFTQDYSVLSDSVKLEQLKKDIKALYDMGNEKLKGVDNLYVEFDSYDDYLASDESFALAMITDSLSVPELISNPNYEVVPCGMSAYSASECRESMFCVSRAYSKTLEAQGISETDRIKRCLDILLLIENDETFRNTLQYGVSGTHYSLGRDGTAYASSNDYIMNPKYTGNLFILYPSDRMDTATRKLAENNWELAKKQNTAILGNVVS